MSYSFSTAAPRDGIADALRAEGEKAITVAPPEHTDAVCDHVDAAIAAVGSLLEVIGPADRPLRVSISGHANTDHEASSSWADETLSISISVQAAESTG